MTELDTIKRAKMYMEKLSQGINPIDGTPVPEGDLTRNARMSRCFAYVAQVLDKVVTNTAARVAKTQPSAPKAAPAPSPAPAQPQPENRPNALPPELAAMLRPASSIKPAPRKQPQTEPETPAAPSFSHNASAAQAIVDTAMQYLGVPYVWGGTSPDVGFDCSGLVYYSYGQHGYSLNRVAQSMYYNGVDVDLNDLQAGDILLFGSSVYNIWHAALYIGGGNFIHAPYSGAVVSIQSLSSTAGMRLVAARRIV